MSALSSNAAKVFSRSALRHHDLFTCLNHVQQGVHEYVRLLVLSIIILTLVSSQGCGKLLHHLLQGSGGRVGSPEATRTGRFICRSNQAQCLMAWLLFCSWILVGERRLLGLLIFVWRGNFHG